VSGSVGSGRTPTSGLGENRRRNKSFTLAWTARNRAAAAAMTPHDVRHATLDGSGRLFIRDSAIGVLLDLPIVTSGGT
jgi:hypothetical protein